jgi:hypothetical protein
MSGSEPFIPVCVADLDEILEPLEVLEAILIVKSSVFLGVSGSEVTSGLQCIAPVFETDLMKFWDL